MVEAYARHSPEQPFKFQAGLTAEFDGTKLDLNKWRFHRSMNGKDCKYVNDERTVRVQNGLLRLQVLPTGEANRPFMLPEGLTTHETMSFRYGYLEMRTRVPFRHGGVPGFAGGIDQQRDLHARA